MARNRAKLVTAGVLAVAVSAGLTVTANGAFATETSAAPASHETARTADAPASELIEMRTARSAGTFYTVSRSEAENAENRNGFTPTGEADGLNLLTEQVPDSKPLNRLRARGNDASYLVSSSPAEQRKLADPGNADRRFDNEGVLGFVYTSEKPGTVKLARYSRNGDWRLARETRSDLINAGYTVDGTVGWVPED